MSTHSSGSLRLVMTVLVLLTSRHSFSQNEQTTAPYSAAVEFPAILSQTVVAGKTPVGTKIRAKLQIATLINGTVFPRNSILAGEVLKSEKKSGAEPSRLAIRMNSIQSKNGLTAIRIYLTKWYYPTSFDAGQNLQYGPSVPANRTWNGQGAYPNPNSPSYKPFPGSDSDKDKNAIPNTGASRTSNHPVPLGDMEAAPADDGAMELVSRHSTIKLDKLTAYIFAGGDFVPKK